MKHSRNKTVSVCCRACGHGKRGSRSPSPGPQRPKELDDTQLDPFTVRSQLTAWDYVKVAINTLWLLPIRLFLFVLPSIFMGSVITVLVTLCEGFDEENPTPLKGWRWNLLNSVARLLDRVFLFGCGFHWIHTKGVPRSAREAPIIVVAPHSSLLDMFILARYHIPTYVCKAEIRNMPFFGIIITRTLRAIYIEREDGNSRTKTNEEIRRRAHSEEAWPKLLIFPEGTTTNRKVLLHFKHGAFTPQLPVQPVLIKYNNRVNTMVWADNGRWLITSLYLTLCQFHNSLEVEFQPVYHPSQEEKDNPKLFAENVRKVMSKGLGIRTSEHAMEDLVLMRQARKRGAPYSSGMVVYIRAKRDLQMNLNPMKKCFKKFAAMDGDRDGYIRVEDLARFLGVPTDACTRAVFNSFQPNADGNLLFRGYLYGVVTQSRPLLESEQFLHMVFEFFDQDRDGIVTQADLFSKLPISSLPKCDLGNDNDVTPEQMNFAAILVSVVMSLYKFLIMQLQEEFKSLLTLFPEYLLIFHECQNAGISSVEIEMES